jgi:hypothetical protein
MGIMGWTVISGGETVLRGTIVGDPHVSDDDGDWCISVKPFPAYEYLLTNDDGYTNHDSTVECEIEPPDDLFGQDAESDTVANGYIGGLTGLAVRVQGIWVRDDSHNVYGHGWPATGLPESGKTEIHPITSLLAKVGPGAATPGRRRFVFFVFSDDSDDIGPTPPSAGESKVGTFRLAIPHGSNLTKVSGGNTSMASQVSFFVTDHGSYSLLKGEVLSGRPAAGKGFYHIVFDVPALFSLRAFLDSPWEEKAGPCDHLAHELQKLKNGKTFDPELKKWIPDPVSPATIAAKQKELDDCLTKLKASQQPLSLRAAIKSHGLPAGKVSLRTLIESAYP